MKTAILAACCSVLAAPALAETLEIHDFAGRVDIRTGNYDRIDVRVVGGNGDNAPSVDEQRNGDVTVDGGRDNRWRWFECRGSGPDMEIRLVEGRGWRWFGFGDRADYMRLSDLPTLEVTAPADVELNIQATLVVGEVGNIGSGRVRSGGCGDLRVGAVAGSLEAAQAGSGSLVIGNIGGGLDASLAGSGELVVGDVGGGLDASVAGSGDMSLGRVRGAADINIAGSGSVTLAAAEGDMDVSIAGSGDVVVRGGQARDVDISVMGSGDVEIGGSVRRLEVRIAGSGDVEVAQAEDSDVRVAGSGDVRIAGVRVD